MELSPGVAAFQDGTNLVNANPGSTAGDVQLPSVTLGESVSVSPVNSAPLNVPLPNEPAAPKRLDRMATCDEADAVRMVAPFASEAKEVNEAPAAFTRERLPMRCAIVTYV